jgi:uncharacterized membrane protein (UPF0127 family)
VRRRGAARLGPCLLLGLTLAGCSGGSGTGSTDAPSVGQSLGERVDAVLGGVELELEVADEPQERAVGLMGRTEVPAGTGMLFDYDEPASGPSFYMFQVDIPLVAVFVLDGRVVHVALMEPCPSADPAQCPLYGPPGEYDAVVETAPAAVADVQVGDRLEL